MDLGQSPVVHQGEWATPVKRDPFSVPLAEVVDWMMETGYYATDLGKSRGDSDARWNLGGEPGQIDVRMQKQERVFASTEGSLCTQTVITIQPNVGCAYRKVPIQLPEVSLPVQAGWERIADAHIPDQLQHAMEQVDDALAHTLPVKPVEIGRYDLVLTADAMATLLAKTLGPATELDRALGYEANAGGTSYLGPHPLTLLGTTVASPLVTVTADRSTPLALATIGWDDEAVAPAPFPLITKGVLVDYQTTREQAAWLAPWYEKQGIPVRSHGCADAPSALSVTMQHTPNLQLHPGPDAQDLDDLVAGIEHGLLIDGLNVHMDFQCNSGIATLGATEVRKGKRVAHIKNAGLLFRSADFWKSVIAVGGPQSQHWTGGFGSSKGEPGQATGYSIAAVPTVVKQQAIIDPKRKA
jgi:TldD protein